ncbi:UTRA domain-containing protein [candidate division KSB3 bacterium]|uniref:UTRA domain-containing protein n=1 Tax=candidate division KSB3 bacterium TaxID=2044937 RepID=A0A9D5JZ90_9BACT|nr:UTRA domain-containing protein [candidate division KSB3 bacterium]MBD3326501.1 UTRA domain-containing protein [candidate division KSB3 bacterium]
MDFKGKTLNKDIPIPLYYQLKEILLETITQSEAGSPFPTELELCKQFDISRPTVRQAINELVIEGYLRRIKGKGTFISESKIKHDFLIALKSFTQEMREKGFTPETKVLEFKLDKADMKISDALNIPVGSDVVRLKRLRSTNGKPIVLVVTYLSHERVPDLLSKDMTNESLYETIERDYGYTIDRATRTLEARTAEEQEAKLLGIAKRDPIQFIETIAYLADGTPIEYSLAEYRGDMSTFSYELKKQSPA